MPSNPRTPPPPYEAAGGPASSSPARGTIMGQSDQVKTSSQMVIRNFDAETDEDSEFEQNHQSQTIPKSTLTSSRTRNPTNSAATATMSMNHNHQNHQHNHHLHRDHNPTSELSDPVTNSGSSLGEGARRKSRPSDIARQIQFIESMSVKKRFFSHITVEPVAFLAILALYIEFPSIQDLIYTKICLQVVSNHPVNLASNRLLPHQLLNSTQAPVMLSTLSSSTNDESNPVRSNISQAGVINFKVDSQMAYLNGSLSSTLAPPNSNGRIGSGENMNQIHIQPLDTSYLLGNSPNAHLLCDRMNKSAAPSSVRQEIADEVSLFWLKYQILVCLLCAISCPYWGGISDQVGRLIPMNTSILAAALSNVISLAFGMLISLNSHQLFRVEWLYIGGAMIGVAGGQAVLIVNAFGFLSDNTTSEARSKRVMVMESVIFVAHSVGFLASKYIMKLGLSSIEKPWLNRHFVAFSACVLLNLLSFLYSICKLRHHKFHRFLNNFEREQQEATFANASSSTLATVDSRSNHANNGETGMVSSERLRELTASTPDDLDGPIAKSDKRWSNTWSILFTLKYYSQTFDTATKERDSRSIILLLLLCGFFSAMSLATLMSLLYVYLKMDPFNWTTSQYSAWNSYGSMSRGVALIGLTICMRFIKGWNVPDALVAALGFLSKGAGLLMIALANSSAIVFWSLVALTPSEFSLPPIRSLLSKLVARDELGKVYSCLAAIQSICFLIGNVAFYLAYNTLDMQNFFQLSFIVVAGFQFAAVIIMLIVDTTLRRRVMII